ncbi:hypothetical protein WL1483_511 [Aeromonas schubertii]|uniref:Uncharacterized protein n=1 Tax=Aeromonas schubertii TaxID=652 RepID=A0A0S2SE22_9GAMM|nr:hypothetical protein WL1483_511 [Aeromonas schubertii]
MYLIRIKVMDNFAPETTLWDVFGGLGERFSLPLC